MNSHLLYIVILLWHFHVWSTSLVCGWKWAGKEWNAVRSYVPSLVQISVKVEVVRQEVSLTPDSTIPLQHSPSHHTSLAVIYSSTFLGQSISLHNFVLLTYSAMPDLCLLRLVPAIWLHKPSWKGLYTKYGLMWCYSPGKSRYCPAMTRLGSMLESSTSAQH